MYVLHMVRVNVCVQQVRESVCRASLLPQAPVRVGVRWSCVPDASL